MRLEEKLNGMDKEQLDIYIEEEKALIRGAKKAPYQSLIGALIVGAPLWAAVKGYYISSSGNSVLENLPELAAGTLMFSGACAVGSAIGTGLVCGAYMAKKKYNIYKATQKLNEGE